MNLRQKIIAIALALSLAAAPAITFATEAYSILGQLAPAANMASVTCTNATPMVCTWTNGGLVNGDQFFFSSGTPPTGGPTWALNTMYFVVGVSGSTFNLATSQGGSAQASTSTGTTLVGNSYRALYTPSGSNSAVMSSMHVCNQSASTNDKVRIAIVHGVVAITSKNFVAFDTSVPFGDCIYPPAATLANGDYVYVYSQNGTSSFSAFGAEEN